MSTNWTAAQSLEHSAFTCRSYPRAGRSVGDIRQLRSGFVVVMWFALTRARQIAVGRVLFSCRLGKCHNMLALVESYITRLISAQTDREATLVLRDVADQFGFESAFLIQYDGTPKRTSRVLDTVQTRHNWWAAYFTSGIRPSHSRITTDLAGLVVTHYSAFCLAGQNSAFVTAIQQHGLVDLVAIAITHRGTLAGLVGFCGNKQLTPSQELGLTLVAYTAFSHQRRDSNHVNISVTPRELEVMRLSSEGLTSKEIAEALGMTAHTANQHADNVAAKLGTRNRANSIAELVRRGFL